MFLSSRIGRSTYEMLTSLCSKTHSPAGLALLGALGISVQDVTGQIGLQCNPVTVIGGATGTSCKAEPVCCQNNNLVSVSEDQRARVGAHANCAAGRPRFRWLRAHLALSGVLSLRRRRVVDVDS